MCINVEAVRVPTSSKMGTIGVGINSINVRTVALIGFWNPNGIAILKMKKPLFVVLVWSASA